MWLVVWGFKSSRVVSRSSGVRWAAEVAVIAPDDVEKMTSIRRWKILVRVVEVSTADPKVFALLQYFIYLLLSNNENLV